jgi:hypothetical protein
MTSVPHLLAALLALATATHAVLPRLQVSENKRFLVQEDGAPFFWLGDTAWGLIHRLDREQAAAYLDDRARRGFNVIQTCLLFELDGLTEPNTLGDLPLEDRDPDRPVEAYFAHADWVIREANRRGLYVGLLPTWGKYWHRKPVFTPAKAEAYGAWLGRRYRDAGVVWILGGDRAVEHERHRAILDAMARGLRRGDGGAHLRTFHPRGGRSSSGELPGADWLDFHMIQSGHDRQSTNYAFVEADYALVPPKPVLDGEPAYEYPPDAMPPDRPRNQAGELQVRRNAWWAVFAGAFGHTYGTHPVWQMYEPGRQPAWSVTTPWHEALGLPGATQIVHLKNLLLSRPFLARIPDQSLLADGPGEGLQRRQATRDGTPGRNDATYLMVYFPEPTSATIDTSRLAAGLLRVWWYDPRTGLAREPEETKNEGRTDFAPPADGDWVLVIDAADRGYPPPGAVTEPGRSATVEERGFKYGNPPPQYSCIHP